MRFFEERRRRREEELAEEIQGHLRMAADDRQERGEPEIEAARAARREFGNVELVKEVTRRTWGGFGWDALRSDLAVGLRVLRSDTALAAVVVLILAIGIGAATALLTITFSVLRRNDPDWYRGGAVIGVQPERNVRIFHFSAAEYRELAGLGAVFAQAGAVEWSNVALATSDFPERAGCAHITGSVLAMSARPLALGRNFRADEDRPGGPRVAILSQDLWRRRFGGAPDVLGKLIQLDGDSYTVVGVTARHESTFGSGVMVPLQLDAADRDRTRRTLWVLVKLRRGVSWEQADARLAAHARAVERQYGVAYPEYRGLRLRFWNLYEAVNGGIRPALLVLLAAVGLLLATCCANVGSLLLARATARRREFSVRAALGAGRLRIVRQMLAESLVLAAAGGASGLVCAYALLPVVLHLIPLPWLPVDPADIKLDPATLAASAGLSLVVGLLFGAAPAWRASRRQPVDAMQEAAQRTGGSRRGSRAREALIVAEVALTLVILTGAALMIATYRRLQAADLGFHPDRILTLHLSAPERLYPRPNQVGAFFERAIGRVRALPGIEGAALVSGLPMLDRTVDLTTADFSIEGRPMADARSAFANANYRVISPGYFDVVGARVLRGRAFGDRDRDGSPPAAVINQTMARLYWPAADPIGQRIRLPGLLPGGTTASAAGGAASPVFTIIGVVADVKQIRAIEAPVRQELYLAEPQAPALVRDLVMMVRSRRDPAPLTTAIRLAVRGVDPRLPIYEVEPMAQVVSDSYGPKRIATVLLGFFAGVALLLSVLGLYATAAYAVAHRTREVGVRMALGADRLAILRLIVGRGVTLAAAGVAIGAVAAHWAGIVLSSTVYGVTAIPLADSGSPTAALAGVATLLVVVALAACYLPARRAAAIDPVASLRQGG